MRFGVLGPLEVRDPDGRDVRVGGPRVRALLTMLLLEAGRIVETGRIIDAQYAEHPPAGAANAVQAHVSRLRRALPPGLVEFHDVGYRLAVAPEAVDAHRFERLAREGRVLLDAGRHADAAAVLREALSLWRGPALPDLPHGGPYAARLEDLRLAATEDRIEAELALGAPGPVVAELRALVAAHPLRERLRGQLMRALHAAGRQAEALAEFGEARRLLAEELGAGPSPELSVVHLAILRAEQPRPPVRRRPAAQLTGFVGRQEELRRLAGPLREARLVTVLGPGGIGKTRLAVEAAARDPREACLADLAPVRDAVQVPLAVLGALGVRESGFQAAAEADPVRRLAAALAGQELLLVLDNCEHVVAAVAGLARDLLGACPGLSIIATSREPLGLTGEVLLPLAPLAAPPPGAGAQDAAAYPAVRLFQERAAAVRPGFAVTPENADAVAAICAALDGLPLAIELAAARLRQLGVREIAARLEEQGRFRLLSRGDRTAAARHRTLHAVVEWSWSLLGPAERALARRFSVFTGSASLEAVEAVCAPALGDPAYAGEHGAGEHGAGEHGAGEHGAGEHGAGEHGAGEHGAGEHRAGDVDDVLADLVDKSLVETDGERYRMLETIRLFCAARLEESGERDALLRAHARHYLELARRADPMLRRAGQLAWLARLSAEHDNLMAALRWAAREEPETAFRMVAALAAYWWLSGRRGQAGPVAAELLARAPRGLDGLEEEYAACVLHAVPRPAPEHWARAEHIMRTLDRELRHPFGAALWGMLNGVGASRETSGSVLGHGDPWNLALVRLGDGLLALLGGRPAEGEHELREVLAVFEELGERWGTAQCLDGLAGAAAGRGEWARARELWARALELMEQLGAPEECADLLCHRAAGLVRQGDLDAAERDHLEARRRYARAGRPAAPLAELGLGEIARLRGELPRARERLTAALEAAEPGGFPAVTVRAAALTALGRLAEAEGDAEAAAAWHGEAVAAALTSPMAVDEAAAAEGAAGAALLTGSPHRAALLLGAAVALRGTAVAGDPDVARVAAAVTECLGPEAFAEAYAQGAGLSAAQARELLAGR
ncbi:hypothetical protein GCM10023259_044100 [Thermocatellispora tengchongensis]|uniref:BTAD domain-containing putative transcriptional regulator n=1 Tax=Thermocatellispora tengchongensis TaxID=1073253 RepID=UPI0031EA5679